MRIDIRNRYDNCNNMQLGPLYGLRKQIKGEVKSPVDVGRPTHCLLQAV